MRSKVCVKHVHGTISKVGRVEVVGAARRCQCKSLVHGTREVIDRDHRTRAGTPALDGSVFRRKQKVRGIAAYLKVRRAVKDNSRWVSAGCAVPLWNGDYQPLRTSCSVVECGKSRTVVRNPPWSRWACNQSPGINQVCVIESADIGDVGGKVRWSSLLGGRR